MKNEFLFNLELLLLRKLKKMCPIGRNIISRWLMMPESKNDFGFCFCSLVGPLGLRKTLYCFGYCMRTISCIIVGNL